MPQQNQSTKTTNGTKRRERKRQVKLGFMCVAGPPPQLETDEVIGGSWLVEAGWWTAKDSHLHITEGRQEGSNKQTVAVTNVQSMLQSML